MQALEGIKSIEELSGEGTYALEVWTNSSWLRRRKRSRRCRRRETQGYSAKRLRLRSPAAENQNPPPVPAPRLFLGDIAKGGGAKERGREEKIGRVTRGGTRELNVGRRKPGDVEVKYILEKKYFLLSKLVISPLFTYTYIYTCVSKIKLK
jgi:hypothetical protein